MGDGGQPGRALPQGTLLPLAQDQAVWTHPLIQRGKVPGADSLSVAEQRNPQRNMDFPLCTMGSRRMVCVALHLAAGGRTDRTWVRMGAGRAVWGLPLRASSLARRRQWVQTCEGRLKSPFEVGAV